jgi:hypothetical protein
MRILQWYGLAYHTSQVKTWGGEESDDSAGGGVKRGRKLSLQGRGEHRFIAVVIRTVL